MIDGIVSYLGSPLLTIRCTVPGFDDYDGFDADTSTWELQVVRAILSAPSDRESRDLAGRGITASKRATVAGTKDLRADREGRADLVVEVPGAKTLTVDGVPGAWTISIDGGPAKAVTITDEAVRIADTACRVYRVADVRSDRHPFTGVEKFSVFLQEAPGV